MAGDDTSGDGPDFLDVLISKVENDLVDGEEKRWMKEDEIHNHPAFNTGDQIRDHPIADAIKALDLEEENPDWEALDQKKQGNFYFKCKKYKTAVKYYTEGVKKRSPNKETNSQLLSNRGAANFHLGNYRSAARDCALACKLNPNYTKAIIKGVNACLELKNGDTAIKWCDSGLMVEPENDSLLDLRKKASILKAKVERDLRKEQSKGRKEQAVELELVHAIQNRNIRIAGAEKKKLTFHHLETRLPTGARVFLGENNSLHWPVVFVYPEFGQTDSISAFNEESRFQDHLEIILGPTNAPPHFDPQRRYRPDTIELYFEDREEVKLWRIKITSTLRCVLSAGKYLIHDGTPSFIVLVKDSEFAKEFLSRYS